MFLPPLLYLIFVVSTISQRLDAALVDGGSYRIENAASNLCMTTQPLLEENEKLRFVVTNTFTFAKEQNWGVEFFSSDRTLSPANFRDNNVTLEASPNSNLMSSVLYDIVSLGSIDYQVKHKKKQLCLAELNRVVTLGSCEGLASTWKFYRLG